MPEMTIAEPTMSAAGPQVPPEVDALYAGAPGWQVPCIADRYDYKKDPGSSDTRHQEDEFRI